VLADAFKRIGLVERTGRGIDLIFEGQLRTGHRPPDYSRSDETGVTVVLSGGSADLVFVRFVIEQERAGRELSLDDLLILGELQQIGHVDIRRVASLTQKPQGQGMAQLERMVQCGWLEAGGMGEKRSYRLAATVREAFGLTGEPAAGAQRVELEHCEVLVREHIRAHGKITRAEAAELCALSKPQAYRLLKRLADRGLLRQAGTGRGAYYEERHGTGE
jgi:ATP-dependent DNA helicase RecG